jgi:fatty acid desaturase
MFPILASLHLYRLFHLAHHRFTNDPERDPDLASLGQGKMVDRFPMSRWQFIKSFHLRPLTEPRAFLRYQRDYIDINVLGRSENDYLRRRRVPGHGESGGDWPRLGAVLGLIYIVAQVAGLWVITAMGRPIWLVWQGVAGTLLVLGVGWGRCPHGRTSGRRCASRSPADSRACCGSAITLGASWP